jgi:hypothetical protein
MFQEYVPKEYSDLHSSSRLVVKVSAVHQKVKGSIQNTDKLILDFLGANRYAFLEKIFITKIHFFLKN